jgi:hypothetical protein
MNRAEQATEGMDIRAAGGIVAINDGFDRWLCREDAYDARYDHLETLPAIDGEEGQSDAYTELCGVGGPIASVVGSSRGNWQQLVRDAVAAGLIDTDVAKSAYGIDVQS